MKDIVDNYDIVICDCPPNLTVPTQNALALSTHYVVPVSPDFLSSLGIALLLTRVAKFSEELESPIKHVGIAMSRVGRPSFYRAQTMESLRTTFGNKVFQTEIRERSAVSEATSKNISVFQMGDKDAVNEFGSVSAEILAGLGLK